MFEFLSMFIKGFFLFQECQEYLSFVQLLIEAKVRLV